jgi:uncharacterized HhH-GPD family protein
VAANAAPSLHLAFDEAADALLVSDPLALVIGMLLDQQVPMERAFAAPHLLAMRLGGRLDPAAIAAMDPDELVAVFSAKPALHRFPGAMARRVQELCRIVVDEHDGDASRIWRQARSGAELVAALAELPGFGSQKARIFAALLGKQLGVTPAGWQEATAPFGSPGVHLSVADIVDEASLAAVRASKAAAKAESKAAAGRRATPNRTARADAAGR